MRRVLVVLALATAALSLTVPADPAHAHTRTEETTNIDSRIRSAPPIEGVTWTVYTGGLLIGVDNRSGGTIEVPGYSGEPYLRVGPDGVHRNRRSPATYLNDERFGDVAVPPQADPAAEPEWVRVSAQPHWVWHDHRAHWMSPQPPAFVEIGPVGRALMRAGLVGAVGAADAQVFQEWTIPFRYDGRDLAVSGELAWEPPPSAWPWLALGLLLAAPAAVAAVRRSGVQAVRPAAWLVLAVAALGAVHLVDDVLAWPRPVVDDLFGLLHTALFLVAGLAGAVWALRGRQGRRLALGVGAGAVLYHQGLVHLPQLLASQFPTVWPPGLIRLTVALALTQALAVAVALARSARPGSPSAEPSAVPSATPAAETRERVRAAR